MLQFLQRISLSDLSLEGNHMQKIRTYIFLLLLFSFKANSHVICDKLGNHYEYHDYDWVGSGKVGHVYKAIREEDGCLFVLKFSRSPSNYYVNKLLEKELGLITKWRELGLFPDGHVEWIKEKKVLIKPWVPGSTFSQHFELDTLSKVMRRKFVDLFKELIKNGVFICDLSPNNLVFDPLKNCWQIIDSKEVLQGEGSIEFQNKWQAELELRYIKNYGYIKKNPIKLEEMQQLLKLIFY